MNDNGIFLSGEPLALWKQCRKLSRISSEEAFMRVESGMEFLPSPIHDGIQATLVYKPDRLRLSLDQINYSALHTLETP